jgi:hypothetical protein
MDILYETMRVRNIAASYSCSVGLFSRVLTGRLYVLITAFSIEGAHSSRHFNNTCFSKPIFSVCFISYACSASVLLSQRGRTSVNFKAQRSQLGLSSTTYYPRLAGAATTHWRLRYNERKLMYSVL